MLNDPRPIMPGDRVRVFRRHLFRDDVTTPLSVTCRPATVVQRYGKLASDITPWHYPDLVDVRFDEEPDHVSVGHFTCFVDVV